MIKLCIFDMDGLLIDSERLVWSKTMDIAAREQGKIMDDEFHRSFMGRNNADVERMIKEKFSENFDYDKFQKRYLELNREYMKNGVPLMKGARELLDYLKKNNIYRCIGTSTERDLANLLLKANKMEDDFDHIICGDEVVNGKPNPEIYLKCFEKFNVDKSEALIFEDGQAGGYAALASGIRLILVPDIATLNEEVRSKAYAVIKDLSYAIDIIKKENERTTSL